MADYVVKLPDVGEGVAEAEIVEWHVHIGDVINEDDALVEVMTDKATVELPSPVHGRVSWLGAEVGDVLAVGSDLVKIDVEGAAPTEKTVTTSPRSAGGTANIDAASDTDMTTDADTDTDTDPEAETAMSPGRGHALAAPAVRQRADDLGIDLAAIRGSGPDGRVTHGDLDTHLRNAPAALLTPVALTATPTRSDAVERIKIVGLRRNIAERMQTAKRRIPHFTYVEEVDVTELERLRAELNSETATQQPRLTVLPFLMRAVVNAIRSYPQMNARFDDDAGIVERHRAVHLGVAAQTSRGLMVPVVKHAESKDLWQCAEEVSRLSEAARTSKISLDDLTGSTITITSLGALGGLMSTPVINYPEVAIIGVNKIVRRPVFVDDVVVPRNVMNLSSSFDHRIIDGADAAAFVQHIKRLLETPALLFVADY